MTKQIITTKRLENGRFQASLITYKVNGNCRQIVSKIVRSDSSEELAIQGVKNAALIQSNLDRLW